MNTESKNAENTNIKYMKRALELAALAKGRTSPNPLVGAVIVKNNEIIGSGYHHKAGTPHAEIHALKAAGKAARGADLYVTLEPCNHTGRTPPCTEAIIKAGIKRVFSAVSDPNPLVAGKGLKRLQEAGIVVTTGLMEKEARRLNEFFFKYIQTKLPFIGVKAAMTLDGKIATVSGESKWITGDEARLHGHRLRNTYDAILVGVGTIISDNPSLTCRLPNNTGRDPIRIILDSKLSLPLDCKILHLQSTTHTIIATTGQAPADKKKQLEKLAMVLTVNDGPKVDLAKLMPQLGKMDITSILVEGGSTVNGSFLHHNLIDKFHLYYAPKIIGNNLAPGPFNAGSRVQLAGAPRLEDITISRLADDILLEGYPIRKGE